ncbi:tetratricopeptide repeat (TPR)-like superfamily protein [Artemisia annua]|uniref:Tetratricopeptide repeat (TPR)-like superfamily protein n=1 Tax=Artemisia annua TaxID=35608 RepID=A0A2U1PSK7_ARTAN|nr:tetratricopeptide repeat (TPR)-like superfamily protein [Artemisia annua]
MWLSRIHTQLMKWDEVSNLRGFMKEKRIKKNPGCSWVQIGKELHAFVASDRSKSHSYEIYSITNLVKTFLVFSRVGINMSADVLMGQSTLCKNRLANGRRPVAQVDYSLFPRPYYVSVQILWLSSDPHHDLHKSSQSSSSSTGGLRGHK